MSPAAGFDLHARGADGARMARWMRTPRTSATPADQAQWLEHHRAEVHRHGALAERCMYVLAGALIGVAATVHLAARWL